MPFFARNEREKGSAAFQVEGFVKESQVEFLLRKAGLVCLLRAE